MVKKTYKKILSILSILIIIAIIILLGILAYNIYLNYTITDDADEFVDDFDAILEEATEEEENEDDTSSNSKTTTSTSTKKVTYKGYEVLGTIEIPKTNVKYPILAKLTTESLSISVVAVFPEDIVLNTVGNVVIMGHNYRNGLFFANNKKLSVGDEIYITDLEGTKVTYYIYKTFTTEDDDASFYNRDTDGKMEITLSTCTDDAEKRLIILASNEKV